MLVNISNHPIHEAIRIQKLKRWWVAEQIGVHRTTLRRWLRGETIHIRKESAVELARVLKVPYEALARHSKC